MMSDFNDIQGSGRLERVRAWSIEQSVEFLSAQDRDSANLDVVLVAKLIEMYVNDGVVGGAITTAIAEGYSEGRLEAKEAIEQHLGDVDLTDLFKNKGWLTPDVR